MPSLPSLLRRGPLASTGRLAAKLPGVKPKRIITAGRATVVVLGGVAAGTAGLLLRRKSAGAGSSAPAHGNGSGPTTPDIANYDAAGPPSNTATPVPAVDTSAEPLAIDEDAEIAAAAAEAGNIGGPQIDYASAEPDMTAGDAEATVLEGGGGVSEGQEQSEADLVDIVNADTGPGAGLTPAEHRIDEVIEAADDPASGETPDPATPPSEGPDADEGR